MSDKKVSDEVEGFVLANIETVGILELLAFLGQNNSKEWSSQDLRKALHSSDLSIEQNLKGLLKIHAIKCIDETKKLYRYEPEDANLDKVLSDLNTAYKNFPLRITELIYSKSKDSK